MNQRIPEMRLILQRARVTNDPDLQEFIRRFVAHVVSNAGDSVPIGVLYAVADTICQFADDEMADWEALQ